jgi:hypothetical protein
VKPFSRFILLLSLLSAATGCAAVAPVGPQSPPLAVENRTHDAPEAAWAACPNAGVCADNRGGEPDNPPRKEPPSAKSKVATIPVPVAATTPNEGFSYGALVALLFYGPKDQVTALVAPQINYNQNFGYTGTLYGAFYPKPDRQVEVNLSQSTIINHDYDVRFRDKTLFDAKVEENGYAGFFADGSARFFGFQSESRRRDQTNYTDQEGGFNVSVGYDIAKNLQLAFGERVRDVAIEHGALKGLPFIGDRFTEEQVPGIDGFTAHAQRIALIHDSMDSRITPTSGLYGRMVFEVSSEKLGSSADYHHYETELKGYFPLDDARFVSVIRLAYSQTLGNNVPFLERSILGGENTLRGYGLDRFIDNSYILANLEERVRLFHVTILEVDTDIELAPFLDAGTVMRDITSIRHENFKYNPGIGFRGIVRPNIVGRVDMGVGSEGMAIFAGLGYPF